MCRKTQVVLKKEFKYVERCCCGGVLFVSVVSLIDTANLSEEQMLMMRKRVAEGADLESIIDEFEGILFERMMFSECENCGYEDGTPLRGGP
jgi:hypothetical protein